MRQPARLLVALAAVVPAVAVDRGGYLADVAGVSYYVPVSGFVPRMTLLVVGVAVPTPGAIGGFHVAYQVAVQTFFGAPPTARRARRSCCTPFRSCPVTLLGDLFMAREGLTLQRAQELAKR